MNVAMEAEHNRGALLRVVAMLCAMVGLVQGGSVATLPRVLRLGVLRLLRPAESALRRLAMALAQDMVVELRPARARGTSKTRSRGTAERKAPFPLTEPLPRTGPPRPKYVPGPGPRISFFDGFDPPIEPTPEPPSPDDPVDAERLCRRLERMRAALEDLPKCARRFALWQARRDAAKLRSPRTSPLRPGTPPGSRRWGKHPVDTVLEDCRKLLQLALAPPDTPRSPHVN